MVKQRNIVIDYIKCAAIIMMVFSHCIQFGNGAEYLNTFAYRENLINKYILSFHMPLFSLISGYLFYDTCRSSDLKNLIKKRLTTLVIPIISWCLTIYLYRILRTIIITGTYETNIIRFIKGYIATSYNCVWFLYGILFSSILVIICKNIFKDKIIGYILFAIAIMFIDNIKIELWLFLYPYFAIGYLFNKCQYKFYDLIDNIFNERKKLGGGLILLIIVHLLLLSGFVYEEHTIYFTGTYILSDFKHIFVNIYRLVIGMAGSLSWCVLCGLIAKHSIPTKIEKAVITVSNDCIGIYVISVFFLNDILRAMVDNTYSILNIIIQTVLITLASIIITEILKKFKVTNILFIGGRK